MYIGTMYFSSCLGGYIGSDHLLPFPSISTNGNFNMLVRYIHPRLMHVERLCPFFCRFLKEDRDISMTVRDDSAQVRSNGTTFKR